MPLNSFQREVLEAFFRREQRFFLTGGAALVGFHFDRRDTKDLDLFTTEEALADGVRTLQVVARELSATIEAVQTAATFRHLLLRRGLESVIVDLVHDLAPASPSPTD
jgi:predicted nucleotidyltransferase